MKRILYLFLCIGLCYLFACKKGGAIITYDYYGEDNYALFSSTLNLPNRLLNYDIELPAHIKPTSYFGTTNDMSTLGRVLFYDTNLSADRSVSCASCHKQAYAFGDNNVLSIGLDNQSTTRNTMPIASTISLKYNTSNTNNYLFWDNKHRSITDLVEESLKDEGVMGMTDALLIERVRESEFYAPLVEEAFLKNLSEIDERDIIRAVVDFTLSIGSVNTPFDNAFDDFLNNPENSDSDLEENDFPLFTALENQGKNLYLANCSSCHGVHQIRPNQAAANNGLSLLYDDKGIGARTIDYEDYGIFKVPTLRNIGKSAPYMHDGSFASLAAVIDHYSNGIADHPNLSEELQDENGDPIQFNFTEEEKEALLAFLNTLTDNVSPQDERYSNPFK